MKTSDQPPLARRTLRAGAGTVGALAAATALLPGRKPAPPIQDAVAQAPSDTTPGYRLTDHVQQYYRTARV